MKLVPAPYIRSLSTQVGLFGIAALITAILLSITIVQHNVLALAAIIAVALAIVWPVETSLGLFAVLMPFDQVLMLGKSGTTMAWVAGAFAGTTLVLFGLVSRRFEMPSRAGLYWGLFVLWSAASTVWAIDPATSLIWLPTVATLFALYIVAVSLRVTRQELSRIAFLAVAGGAVVAALVIFQYLNHVSFQGRASLVVGTHQSGPNALPYSLLLPFSLAVGGVLSEESLLKRTALLVALALMTISMFLAMSRGALIALLASVLVCLFKVGVQRRILIPILILAIPLFFLPNLFYQRLEQGRTNRGTGRYDIWLVGLEIIKHYPATGTGLGNFSVAYRKASGSAHVFPSHGYEREPHNTYLQVCTELGLIGFAFFVVAIWSQMRSAWRALSSSGLRDCFGIAIEAACWGQLVMGLSWDIARRKPFWLAFSLLALVAKKRPKAALNGLSVAGSAESIHPINRNTI